MPNENVPPQGSPQPPAGPPAAQPPAQPPAPPPGGSTSSFWGRFIDAVIHPYSLFGLLAVGGIAFIFWAISRADGGFLRSLQDVETARGLITFLIAVTTIVIALILALYPVTSSDEQAVIKERFGLGKEVLTILIGVLGTIVGFYFGSAEKGAPKLELADIRVVDTRVATHVSGGVAPYRYTVKYGDKTTESKVSSDGWILEPLGEKPKVGTVITVDATDGKDQRATKRYVVGEKDGQAESGSTAAKPQPPNPQPPSNPGAKSSPEAAPVR